jgi:hypothetical protein
LDKILSDAEQRTGVKRGAMTVIRAEAVIWNDGSLGCPQPGVAYVQVLMEGFWVVVRAGDNDYDYRATANGYFSLCTHPKP